MLTDLHIKNLALVDELTLAFGKGLTVLTGETGAGKSVVITALALALGARSDREYVRHGASAARVEAIFSLESTGKATRRALAAYANDDSIMAARHIRADGRSRAELSGQQITLAELQTTLSPLVEIMGQHAGQRLLSESEHLPFLDELAGLTEQAERVAESFDAWQRSSNELTRVRRARDLLEQERELLLFQQNEIAQAAVEVGEEERLLAEKRVLDNARQLMQSASQVVALLDGEGESALELLRRARQEIDAMAAIDRKLRSATEQIDEARLTLEELRRTVEAYGTSVVDDPVRLNDINARLDELYRLKKKYGGSESSILQALGEIDSKLTKRPQTDDLIVSLEQDTERNRAAYADQALDLSVRRTRAAKRLASRIEEQLASLAIDGARFRFELFQEEDPEGVVVNGRAVKPLREGLETARILFSANPGEPLRSLVRTASGGELSRVLLAVRSAVQKRSKKAAPLLVFDEVDAGIGGQTANRVADALADLAQAGQVLVVTHLPQIAKRADHHFVVEKQGGPEGRRLIAVRRLTDEERPGELARMQGVEAEG